MKPEQKKENPDEYKKIESSESEEEDKPKAEDGVKEVK
jgi:hypothetical protein